MFLYGLDSWVGKILWRRKWQSIPVFLPGESHGQRSLVGYSPWGHKESDMTEVTEYTCSLYTNFNDSFYHEWMLNIIKNSLLHLLMRFYGFYYSNNFILVNVVYHIDRFGDTKKSLNHRDKSHLTMM